MIWGERQMIYVFRKALTDFRKMRVIWATGSGSLNFPVVMRGLDLRIHAFVARRETWMAGSSPAMTMGRELARHSQLSFPAKVGNPVRRGLSISCATAGLGGSRLRR